MTQVPAWHPEMDMDMRIRTLTGLTTLIVLLIAPGFISAQNWRTTTSPNTANTFFGVSFANDQTGYAVGGTGEIYKTVDGGLSWAAQISNTLETLYDVS